MALLGALALLLQLALLDGQMRTGGILQRVVQRSEVKECPGLPVAGSGLWQVATREQTPPRARIIIYN